MLIKEAKVIVGGLSSPGKMPCPSYGLPAKRCNVGSKLAKIKGSVCFNCYALKGQYRFSNVQEAQERRFQSLDGPQWVEAMIKLIEKMPFFRWHDSGDIRDLVHLQNIVEVCEGTDGTRHWLPTREYGLIQEWLNRGLTFPDNLVIRVSAPKVDGTIPQWIEQVGMVSSTVHNHLAALGQTCPAYKQNGECGDCRACWDSTVQNVSYPEH